MLKLALKHTFLVACGAALVAGCGSSETKNDGAVKRDTGADSGKDAFIEPWLYDGRQTLVEDIDLVLVDINRHHVMAVPCKTGRRHRTNITDAENADFELN